VTIASIAILIIFVATIDSVKGTEAWYVYVGVGQRSLSNKAGRVS
jgi:hypothetical protein